MIRGRQLVGANGFIYSAQVPSNRPVTDYTARVIPHFPGVAIPLEVTHILWQR
jgi:starch phosphorylase